MPVDEVLGSFFIAIACGVVLGIAALLLIYKMVDGDLPPAAGLSALIIIALVMALAIRPPHPSVPGVVLVMALTLMAFFPYAENVLEQFELRAVDANRMAKSYAAIQARPDNFAAKFELAKLLHEHGFQAQAINLAGSTLTSLSHDRDDVRNSSVRDMFYREEALLQRWQQVPADPHPITCTSCGTPNQPHEIFCAKCGRPYLLDVVRGQEIKPRVWAKLVLAWASLALLIPGAVAIVMSLDGIVRILSFAGALAIVGLLLTWLFKPPKHAPEVWSI